jgi:hypothetical protein
LTTSFCDLTRTEAKAKGAIGALDRLTKRANAAAQHETDHKIPLSHHVPNRTQPTTTAQRHSRLYEHPEA